MKRLLPIGGTLIIAAVVCGACAGLSFQFAIWSDRYARILEWLIGAAVCLFAAGVLCLLIGFIAWHQAVNLDTHRRKNRLCRGCGYDLRVTLDIGRTACPECGRPYTADDAPFNRVA